MKLSEVTDYNLISHRKNIDPEGYDVILYNDRYYFLKNDVLYEYLEDYTWKEYELDKRYQYRLNPDTKIIEVRRKSGDLLSTLTAGKRGKSYVHLKSNICLYLNDLAQEYLPKPSITNNLYINYLGNSCKTTIDELYIDSPDILFVKDLILLDNKKWGELDYTVRKTKLKKFSNTEYVNKFIKHNNIENVTDSRRYKHFTAIYDKIEDRNKLEFLNPKCLSNLDDYSTLEDFQKYIDEHNIQSPSELRNSSDKLALAIDNKISRLHLAKKIKYPNRLRNFSELETINDFQRFIDNNNIQNFTDFKKRFPIEATKLTSLRLARKVTYSGNIGHPYEDEFKILEDFQKYVDDNNIRSAKEFSDSSGIHHGIYRRMLSLKLNNSVVYPDGRKTSYGETKIIDLLNNLGISYIHDKTADFLSPRTRLDFRLETYKLVIEYQGVQHFIEMNESCKFISLSEQKEKDRIKYLECITNGYKVLYAAFPELDNTYKKVNLNDEYIDKIYTTIDDLKTEILNIIQQHNENNSNLSE